MKTVACRDCVRCRKHVFFTHGDHQRRLCRTPWYFLPYLRVEDLSDIERLIDCRLAPVAWPFQPGFFLLVCLIPQQHLDRNFLLIGRPHCPIYPCDPAAAEIPESSYNEEKRV